MRTIPDREQRLLLYALAIMAMGSAVLLFVRGYAGRVPLTATRRGELAVPSPSASVPGETPPRKSRRTLNPNYATEAELMSLPGIGPVLARSIIRHRKDHIFFDGQDLAAVRGIGPETLSRLLPRLEFESAHGPDGGD